MSNTSCWSCLPRQWHENDGANRICQAYIVGLINVHTIKTCKSRKKYYRIRGGRRRYASKTKTTGSKTKLRLKQSNSKFNITTIVLLPFLSRTLPISCQHALARYLVKLHSVYLPNAMAQQYAKPSKGVFSGSLDLELDRSSKA